MNMNMNMNMMSSNWLYTGLLFLLLSLSVYISGAAAAEAPEAVMDIDGKQLRAGVEYYILPVGGGGLTIAAGNKTCDVAQERSEVRNGLPVSFHPVNPKKGVVRVSTDHNIKFSAPAPAVCVQSTAVWKLDYEESTQKYVVTTGGVEGKPGQETISNWFKIHKIFDTDSDTHHYYYYKLVFCPTVCNYCKVICRDVSISVDGLRRLIVNLIIHPDDPPFKIMFKEAYSKNN